MTERPAIAHHRARLQRRANAGALIAGACLVLGLLAILLAPTPANAAFDGARVAGFMAMHALVLVGYLVWATVSVVASRRRRHG